MGVVGSTLVLEIFPWTTNINVRFTNIYENKFIVWIKGV